MRIEMISSDANELTTSESELSMMLHTFCRRVQELHFYVCESLLRKYSDIRHAEHICVSCGCNSSDDPPVTDFDRCSEDNNSITDESVISTEICNDPSAGLSDQVVNEFSALRPLYETLTKSALLSDGEGDLYRKRLAVCNHQLVVIDRFLDISTLLSNVVKQASQGHYGEAAGCLRDVTLECQGPLTERESEVQEKLRTELIIAREKLLVQLTEVWSRSFQWSIGCNSAMLIVVYPEHEAEKFCDVIGASISCGKLDWLIRGFCDKFMISFIDDVISKRKLIVGVTVTGSEQSFSVEVITESLPRTDTFQTLHSVVSHLPELVSFLRKIFCCVPETLRFIEALGSELLPRLGDALHDLVLIAMEDEEEKTSGSFNDLLPELHQLDEAVSDSGMVAQGGRTFSSYADIGYCVARHRIKELSAHAHELMMEGLQFCTRVSKDHPLGDDCKSQVLETWFNKTMGDIKQPVIPACQVSLCTVQLMRLIYELMSSVDNDDQRSVILIHESIHNIMELYVSTTAMYHKQLLQSVPLVAALHYNNCMYLAHHLQLVGATLGSVLLSAASQPPSYQRLVVKLKQQAQDVFNTFVEEKRIQLVGLLQNDNDFVSAADNEGRQCQKILQGVMCQLRHVAFVWRDTLSTSLYYKTLGILVNSVLFRLVDLVLCITEFSEADSSILARQFAELQHSVIQLVAGDGAKSPSVILQEHVSNWLRLVELTELLRCSLSDVADRWASGKGPLSLHFTAGEVSRLITAMYEDTSNRRMMLFELQQVIDAE